MNPQRLVLPCSCVVMAEHDHGDRLVTCAGDDPHRVDRRCKGGKKYVVTAERIESVLHTVREFTR